MALDARSFAYPFRFGEAPVTSVPALSAATRTRERLWNLLPFALSVGLISTIFWAPWNATTAAAFAVFLLAFFVYWLVRSYSVAVACVIGLMRIRRWKRTDWQARYAAWLPSHPAAAEWDWPRHMVIIPNYKEHESSLARTLDSLASAAAGCSPLSWRTSRGSTPLPPMRRRSCRPWAARSAGP